MPGVAGLGLCWGKLVHCDHLHHCSFGEQVRSLDPEVLMVWDHSEVDLTDPVLRDPCGLEDPWALVLPFVQVVLQEDPLVSA
jgi:hypothetical protein